MGDVIEIESSEEVPQRGNKTNNHSLQHRIIESRRKIRDFQTPENEKQQRINSIPREIQEREQKSKQFLDQMNQKYSGTGILSKILPEDSPYPSKKVKQNNSTEPIKIIQQNGIEVRQFQSQIIEKSIKQQIQIDNFFSLTEKVNQELDKKKVNDKEGYLYKKQKIEEFIQQMIHNTYSIMRDDQDRKVLAEYMYEKRFRSFNEYLQSCSDDGRSLLTDPYKYFNIERKIVQRSEKEKQIMKEKQLLLQLHEELEPRAILHKQEKRDKRIKIQQNKLKELLELRKEKQKLLSIQFLENQKLEKRKQVRQAGIIFHRRQLIRELRCIQIKEEEQSIQATEKIMNVDQSILSSPFHTDQLKTYKIKVIQMIIDAYSDAKLNITKKLEEKRNEEQERRERLRQEKKSRKQHKPIQLKVKDILHYGYSQESEDSIVKIVDQEEIQQRLIQAQNSLILSPVKEKIPRFVELVQPTDTESFQSSIENSLCGDQYQNDFVIVKGNGWLAVPNN